MIQGSSLRFPSCIVLQLPSRPTSRCGGQRGRRGRQRGRRGRLEGDDNSCRYTFWLRGKGVVKYQTKLTLLVHVRPKGLRSLSPANRQIDLFSAARILISEYVGSYSIDALDRAIFLLCAPPFVLSLYDAWNLLVRLSSGAFRARSLAQAPVELTTHPS
jgi:hypothetical protein